VVDIWLPGYPYVEILLCVLSFPMARPCTTDEDSAKGSLFTRSKLEVVSFWSHLLSALWGPGRHRAGPDYERQLQLSNLVVSLEQHRRTRQKAASDAVGTSSASQNSPPMATSSSSEKTKLDQMAALGSLGHFDFIHFQDLISSWTFCSSVLGVCSAARSQQHSGIS
jgi:hypothetical protein